MFGVSVTPHKTGVNDVDVDICPECSKATVSQAYDQIMNPVTAATPAPEAGP